MNKRKRIYGGIEAGGTKFVCAVGTGLEDIRAETRFPTTSPEETIGRAMDFFREFMKQEHVEAIGIGSFGPLDLHRESHTYGYITTSPKDGWTNVDFAGKVAGELGIPINIDSDVNAAALGEQKWGAARGLDTFIYLTVGTGIGGGGVINGKTIRGLVHPEMGHMMLPHDIDKDPFQGSCPYHGDCWEGLASGMAMEARWGMKPEELHGDHPAWELEAVYLAQGISNLVVTVSPQRVIIGGGIMKKNGLIETIRKKVQEILAGYVQATEISERIAEYIILPGLGDRSGVLGSIALAMLL